MKKVLIVDFNGTAPSYTYYFAKGLEDNEMSVAILGAELSDYTDVHPKKMSYIGISFPNKQLNYFLNWGYLFFIARSYSAVHLQWLPMLKFSGIELFLVKCLLFLNSNIYYTVHNFYPHNTREDKIKRRYLRLYKLLNNLVVHTPATSKKIEEQIGIKKIVQIKHGYFYSELMGTNQNKNKKLLMLGNIQPYKGVEDAIEVIDKLIKKERKVILKVIGKSDKDYFSSLESLVKEKGLERQVELANRFVTMDELLSEYRSSYLTIMPYKEIEQSGVLYTSLGLGVPVAGYKTGGMTETIINKHNGYLVEKGNIEALCEAVIWCLDNNEVLKPNILDDVLRDIWKENGRILKKEYFQ